MKVLKFEGKDEQVALEKALSELSVNENQVIYKMNKKKGGLFKGNIAEIEIVPLKDIVEFSKEYLNELLSNMGIEDINFESSIKNNTIYLKIHCSNNALLIGKEGRNLIALQNILRQVVINKIVMNPKIILDVENYKDKKNYFLEKAAIKTAKEVRKTKIAAKLEDMNSYQRRIVHTALSNFKGITTESEGNEPHRHIVIKPKGEK